MFMMMDDVGGFGERSATLSITTSSSDDEFLHTDNFFPDLSNFFDNLNMGDNDAAVKQINSSSIAAATRPPSFDGMHYKRWRTKAVLWFTNLGCFSATDARPEGPLSAEEQGKFEKVDAMFKAALFSILGDNIVDPYMAFDHGKDAWDALEAKFGVSDAGTELYVEPTSSVLMGNGSRASVRGVEHFDNPVEDVNEAPKRSKRQRTAKSFGHDFIVYLVDDTPTSISEAYASQDADYWKEAVRSEMDSILANGTWEVTDRPYGCKPVGCKWVFKKKLRPNGTIEKYKARLVAKGYTQKEGFGERSGATTGITTSSSDDEFLHTDNFFPDLSNFFDNLNMGDNDAAVKCDLFIYLTSLHD
ncbi:hypothetical protein QYE76_057398 [Lolium multiflorum]|uniref:Reverse transcriptase Ty1/copia-type domain-containing protein n=1 Tax=Lolium multiflorum TaxID=4521 RepID=A0AAD8T4K1_LOLMU|nr:hypothetical protein QYE76_057398 [Lolium multiflorum]